MSTLTPVARWLGAQPWLPQFLSQITWVDVRLQHQTNGAWSLLRIAGLPSLMLMVPGRRSGLVRSTPMICVPYQQGHLIVGSNFGKPRTPAWVWNLRALVDQQLPAEVTIDGVHHQVIAQELSGQSRALAWHKLLTVWPNYRRYEANTSRTLPIFFLHPLD